MAKSLVRLILRILYRVEVEGLEHACAPYARGDRRQSCVVPRWSLAGAFLPGNPVFAIDTFIAKKWWVKPFLVIVDAMPIDPTNPLSLRA